MIKSAKSISLVLYCLFLLNNISYSETSINLNINTAIPPAALSLGDIGIEDMETQIQDMRESLNEQNIERLRRDAHAIKGGAGTLEAKPLAIVAKQMENLCKSNDLKEVPSALDKVVTEFDRLKTFVESCSRSRS